MHPSYVFSKNLTNSLHIDTGDDSKSFAIFFQQEMNGLTWFLFPFYGIAIECSRHTVISWDGKTMFHCSCTVSDGLYSFFTTGKKDVSRQEKVKQILRKKKRKHNAICKGDEVYTKRGERIHFAMVTGYHDKDGDLTQLAYKTDSNQNPFFLKSVKCV